MTGSAYRAATHPRRSRGLDLPAVAAFCIYAASAFFVFGRALIGSFGNAYIGKGADPDLFLWFLRWWPHAIANRIDPLTTDLLWAPSGFNLTWSSGVPLLGIAAAPFTRWLGPIVTFNGLCLAGVALTAWCGFLLCRRLTSAYWPSVLGGFIFAFSPTLLGQMVFGHLHTIWIFPVPLILYFVAKWFHDEITSVRLTSVLAVLLAIQFFISMEIVVTFLFFAGIGFVLVWIRGDELRPILRALAVNVAIGGGCAFVTAIPYLYHFLANQPYSGAVWPSTILSTDLLNLIVPTSLNEIGRLALFDRWSAPFNAGNPAESGGFLAYPLIAVVAMFAFLSRGSKLGVPLLQLLLLIVLLSLGARLVLQGRITWSPMPWWLMHYTPLKNAATVRFGMYAYLVIAIMTSLWLSSAQNSPVRKTAIVAMIVVCMMPNLSSAFWVTSIRTPTFFTEGLYRQYLAKDDTVLALPFWTRNDSMRWQAETGMYFRLAQGCGPPPKEFREWPIIEAFPRQTYVPKPTEQLKAYLVAHRVDALIVAEEHVETWRRIVDGLGVVPIRVGGVFFYSLARMDRVSEPLSTMRDRHDSERFNMMVTSAHDYLSRGGSLSTLSAATLTDRGYISADTIVGPPPPPEFNHPEINWAPGTNERYGLWLYVNGDRVVVGEWTTRASAERLQRKFGRFAFASDFHRAGLHQPEARTVRDSRHVLQARPVGGGSGSGFL
jgi:hypothetical protein